VIIEGNTKNKPPTRVLKDRLFLVVLLTEAIPSSLLLAGGGA